MKRLLFSIVLLVGLKLQAEALAQTAEAATAVISESAQKEQEIPVILDGPKKTADAQNSLFKYTLAFGVIGIMGCVSYFLLRKYRFKNPAASKTQIKVLTQHYLGPKKSLAIIRVAGESILIGVTDNNINLIKSLALLDEDIPEETAEKIPNNFSSVFNSKLKNQTISETGAEASADEFAFSGIRDIVSGKLKNMRNL